MEKNYLRAEPVILDGKVCPDLWEIKQKYITNGGFGRVLNACCGDDCGYIAKVLDIEGTYETNNYELLEEIKFQQTASKLGLAPKIVYVGITKKDDEDDEDEEDENYTAYVIMEQMKITLSEHIKNNPNTQMDYIEPILQMLLKLHKEALISHSDIHMGNIMLDKENNLQFIDFGESSILRSFDSDKYVDDFKRRYNDYSSFISSFKLNWDFDISNIVIEFILKNENPLILYTPVILNDDLLEKNSILKKLKKHLNI